MRNVSLAIAAVLSLAAPALAQDVNQEDLVRQLAPARKPLTRSLTGGAPSRQIVVERGREEEVIAAKASLPAVNLPKVTFEYDSAVLTPEGAAILRVLGAALQDPRLGGSRFLIGGHTDARGSDDYNLALSERRAAAVRDFLMARHGVQADRLVTMGFGEKQPADPRNPEAALNRRVEVVNLTQ